MGLVVAVESRAGVLELDLGIEDDVLGDLIGRQQYQAMRVEPVLPLSAAGFCWKPNAISP
jgi:hypothetical protein